MEEKIRLAVFGQKRLSREGGVEIVVKELCTRMAQNGCDVTCYNRAGHHVSGAEYDKTIEYDGIRTDYGFVFIGFQYGLVILLIYILANTALMKKFFRQQYYIEFFIVLIYAIYTIVESYSASTLMNTSLILLSILLYQNNKNMYLNGGESQ